MNNAPLRLSGAGVLALGIQLFVILHDVLRFAVAFDQQLVGREDFGVHLRPFCGVRAIPCALQLRGDGGGIHWHYAGLYHASQVISCAILL